MDHYGKEKASTYKSFTINQVGDIDVVSCNWRVAGFHKYMFKKHKAEEEKFQTKLMNCKNKKERDTFCASKNSFDAHKLYATSLNDKACAIIFPNGLKLLHLMLIFPLSTACVKRFFSKMNLVKTWLRNQLSQVNLENLFFTAKEAPKTGFTHSKYYFFVDELKKNNMRIDVWSTLF